MTNTALGAGAEKAQEIIFISEAHEKFYYEKLKEVRYQDVYHKALCYCLGINDDTRRNANRILCISIITMLWGLSICVLEAYKGTVGNRRDNEKDF